VIESASTLKKIATDLPAAARVFARHRLDFCCHGQRSLAEACVEKGIDPGALAEEIERASSQSSLPSWAGRPSSELIDFILQRYHAGLRDEVAGLLALAEKVERVHAEKPACPRGLAAHLGQVLSALESHLDKEEQILFPLIRAGGGADARTPISVMMREHEDHGASLSRTRELTNDLVAPPEACGSWRALYQGLARLETDLMEHIHLENNVLFPGALRE